MIEPNTRLFPLGTGQRMTSDRSLVFLLLSLVGCGGAAEVNALDRGGDEPDRGGDGAAGGGSAAGAEVTTRTLDDRGAVCLSPSDDSVGVRVVFQTCLSSSCEVVRAATCSATFAEGRLVVSSHLEYDLVGGGIVCTTDCGRATATCGDVSIPAGSHAVSHGSDADELSAPLSEPLQLFGSSGDCAR